jgi:hypothetical protein
MRCSSSESGSCRPQRASDWVGCWIEFDVAIGRPDVVASIRVRPSETAGRRLRRHLARVRRFAINDLKVADLNGDGKAEVTWFDTAPSDHDRILVSGDVAALTAVSTTTTTSTTLPVSSDCSALSGLARAQCFCAAPLAPPACASAALPAKLTTKFTKACSLLGTATTASGKKQKKLFGKAAGRFGGLVHAASKKATKKLPAGCGDGLRAVFTTMRDDVRAARKAVGH